MLVTSKHWRAGTVLAAVVLFAVGGASGQSYDHTWLGTYGCTFWTDAEPIPDNNYGNGWGETWYYTQDSAPYYPGTSDSVLVPDGVYLDVTSGDGVCHTLTVGDGASAAGDSGIEVHGHAINNDGYIGLQRSIHCYGPAVTLGGDGETRLLGPIPSGGGASSIFFYNYHCDANFEAGQDIHGTGDIGVANPQINRLAPNLTNHATIRADAHDYNPLRIHGWTTCVNNGLLVASSGGDLEVAGQWNNSAGVIRAEDNATVTFYAGNYDMDDDGHDDGEITGGRIESIGTGSFTSLNGDGFVLQDLTVAATLQVPSGNEHLGFAGQIDTEAGAELRFGRTTKAGTTYGTMDLHADMTLSGPGQTILGYRGRVDVASKAPGAKTLTVGAGHTLIMHQTCRIDPDNNEQIALANHGTIHYQPIIAGAEDLNTTHYVNGGTANEGTFLLDAPNGNGKVIWYGDITQNSGEMIVNAYLHMNGGGGDDRCQILGGVLGGSGRIRNDTQGVYVGPDATISPANSTGTLTITGSLTLGDGAAYLCEVDDVRADMVVVGGELTFDGALNVTLTSDGLTTERTTDLTLFEFGSLAAIPTVNIIGPSGWTWGSVSQVGNNLVLSDVHMIPEPASLALLGMCGLLVGRRR